MCKRHVNQLRHNRVSHKMKEKVTETRQNVKHHNDYDRYERFNTNRFSVNNGNIKEQINIKNILKSEQSQILHDIVINTVVNKIVMILYINLSK